MKKEAAGIIIIIAYLLAIVVIEMPAFGDPQAPASANVIPHYLEKGVEETGSFDIVTSIILDYRAYDTLFEATVLYTAALGIRVVLGSGSKERSGEDGGSDNKKD